MSDGLRELMAGPVDVPVSDLLDGIDSSGGRARLVAIMIASIDGRTSVGGRSTPLGHPADRALLRGLRARADAVLVGSRTLRAERYANLIDPADRERRLAAGLPAHPIVATISRSGRLPDDVPLFSEPGVELVVFAEAAPEPGEQRVVCFEGGLSPQGVIGELAGRGAGLIVCEGGPVLLAWLLAAGVVDDLLLTISPRIIGGEGALTTGPLDLAGTPAMTLGACHRAGDHLFLHYRAGEDRG